MIGRYLFEVTEVTSDLLHYINIARVIDITVNSKMRVSICLVGGRVIEVNERIDEIFDQLKHEKEYEIKGWHI